MEVDLGMKVRTSKNMKISKCKNKEKKSYANYGVFRAGDKSYILFNCVQCLDNQSNRFSANFCDHYHRLQCMQPCSHTQWNELMLNHCSRKRCNLLFYVYAFNALLFVHSFAFESCTYTRLSFKRRVLNVVKSNGTNYDQIWFLTAIKRFIKRCKE